MWKSIALYALTGLLCYAGLYKVMELKRADWSVPFKDRGDAMFYHLLVKSTIDNGWYRENPLLGAPYGMALQDFPLCDSAHVAIIRAISATTHNVGKVANIYFVLTYLLSSWAALFALRSLGIRALPAMAAAILFALSPYHFWRAEGHFFLMGYFLVPPLILVALRIYSGQMSFAGHDPSVEPIADRPRSRRFLWLTAVAICILGSSTGVYYAFFGSYLMLAAGILGSIRLRSVRPVFHASLLIGVVGMGVMANLIPTHLYIQKYGSNHATASRFVAESDIYGLKIAQLVLPRTDHRIGSFDALKRSYNSMPHSPLPGDYGSSLGLLGLFGFLSILTHVLASSRDPSPSRALLAGLGALCLAGLLLACPGGIGPTFSFLVTPQIRCYDRMSIVVDFLALAGLAVVLDGLLRRIEPSRPRTVLMSAAILSLLAFGIWEQSSPANVPPYSTTRAAFYSDREFVGELQSALPPDSMVFQLPLLTFPESGSIHNCHAYDHFRLYLHSGTLRWSHGTTYGRYGSGRLQEIGKRPVLELLPDLVRMGYSAICIDRDGYKDAGKALEIELSGLLTLGVQASPNGRYSYFSLLEYTRTLKAKYTEAEWETLVARFRHKTSVTAFGRDFRDPEVLGARNWRWVTDRHAEVTLYNPSDRVQPVSLRFGISCHAAGDNTLTLTANDTAETVPISQVERIVERTFDLPPGSTFLKFDYAGAVSTSFGGDPQTLYYAVANFEVVFP